MLKSWLALAHPHCYFSNIRPFSPLANARNLQIVHGMAHQSSMLIAVVGLRGMAQVNSSAIHW
jgi:hypothetical protein